MAITQAADLPDLYDIEGHVTAAVVEAFRAIGQPITEALRGEDRSDLRLEINADIMAEDSDRRVNFQGQEYRHSYQLALHVGIRGPASQYEAFRHMRALARAKLAWPCGLSFVNARLSHHEAHHIIAMETTSEIDEAFDELASTMTYSLHITIPPGAFPRAT